MTDKSPEGTQFTKGFSGLGGFLRYKVDLDIAEAEDYEEEEDDDFIWSWLSMVIYLSYSIYYDEIVKIFINN